jgi:predicted acyltransferase
MDSSKRIISVDSMRGYTIAVMLMVNFPGNSDKVYPTLQHSAWNGLTFTDIVAPFFLFIVGTSIVLAFDPKIQKGTPPRSFHRKIIIRAVKIFAIGMFLNLLPQFDFSNIRWTGTLHRISIVYFVCSFLFLYTNWRQQIWLSVVILVGYWIAMTTIPTPGYDRVMLEPGVNLAAWVDSQYLPGRMWQGTWDPEGILSTFPSIVTCLTGMLAGRMIRSRLPTLELSVWLMVVGVGLAIIGYFWGLVFPVNENLWTSSFVAVTSGFAFLLLGSALFLVDIQGYTRYAQTGIIFGSNAIAVYVLADILSLVFYQAKFGSKTLNTWVTNGLDEMGLSSPLSSMIYAVAFVSICFIPCLWMYRKKIFIKV